MLATCKSLIHFFLDDADNGSILGSSFLKNAYSIYNYPDQAASARWQPTIGLIPLTNASVACQDFYAVRTNRESLRSVSSDQSNSGESDPWNPQTSASPVASSGGGKKATSTAVIIACSVVGFFVLAAAAFAAWWFWLRRKFGAAGVVEYKRRSRDEHSNHDSDHSGSTRRARKHQGTMRQKSMIEGYSDYAEGDSWVSETGDSIRLGHIPEVAEDGEEEFKARPTSELTESETPPRSHRVLDGTDLLDEPIPVAAAHDDESTPGRRGSSPRGRISLTSPENRSSYAQAGPYPTMSKSNTSRSLSVSMSGPFPSSSAPGARQSTIRPDASPMYDINTSDYFKVPPSRGRDNRRASQSRERDQTPSGSRSINPANPFDTP
jgi:hypothetical protein